MYKPPASKASVPTTGRQSVGWGDLPGLCNHLAESDFLSSSDHQGFLSRDDMLQLEEYVAEHGVQWKKENEVTGKRQRRSRVEPDAEFGAVVKREKKEKKEVAKKEAGGAKRKSGSGPEPQAKIKPPRKEPFASPDSKFVLDFASGWKLLQEAGCKYGGGYYRPPDYVKGSQDQYEDISGLCNFLHDNEYLKREEYAGLVEEESLALLEEYVANETSKWKSKVRSGARIKNSIHI